MALFQIFFKHRIGIEGGWDNKDQNDDGNWTGGKQGVGQCVGTTWGVTAPEYSKFLGRTATIEDMKNMPQSDAVKIFKPKYWDVFRGDELTEQGIANDLGDAAVNEGLQTAIMQLQEAAGLNKTGKMDDNTLKHLNNQA